jgi:hypothetical protein
LGHRVGDGPVPQLSSTGAVTSAADLTSGGSDPEFAKKESATALDAAAAAGAARSAPRARVEATEQVNAAAWTVRQVFPGRVHAFGLGHLFG